MTACGGRAFVPGLPRQTTDRSREVRVVVQHQVERDDLGGRGEGPGGHVGGPAELHGRRQHLIGADGDEFGQPERVHLRAPRKVRGLSQLEREDEEIQVLHIRVEIRAGGHRLQSVARIRARRVTHDALRRAEQALAHRVDRALRLRRSTSLGRRPGLRPGQILLEDVAAEVRDPVLLPGRVLDHAQLQDRLGPVVAVPPGDDDHHREPAARP